MNRPSGQTKQRWRLLEHWRHERRRDDLHDEHEGDRQKANDVARHALLRRQGPDLTLDPDALANRERDRVEDLREVATDLVLDGDGGDHQLEVLGLNSPDQVGERVIERQAKVDLANDARELGRDGRLCLAHDNLNRLEQR